jgi:hypothetical protein
MNIAIAYRSLEIELDGHRSSVREVRLHAESFAEREVTSVRNLSINSGYAPVTPVICPLADTTRRKASDCPDGRGRTSLKKLR